MDPEKELLLQYISNAGILLTDTKNTILIDPFTDDTEGIYEETPKKIRLQLMEDIRMGWVDAIIVTHEHPDHFSRKDILEAMRLNAKVILITTPAVAECILDSGNSGIDAGRILTFKKKDEFAMQHAADKNEPAGVWQCGDFTISFWYVLHEGEQYRHVENLASMIRWKGKDAASIDGIKVIVTGDAQPGRVLTDAVNTTFSESDWLIAPFPYVGTDRGRRWLASVGRIGHIMAVHFPLAEKDTMGWKTNTLAYCRQKDGEKGNVIFPERIGTWQQLSS